jgi:hypothetical protein
VMCSSPPLFPEPEKKWMIIDFTYSFLSEWRRLSWRNCLTELMAPSHNPATQSDIMTPDLQELQAKHKDIT